MRRVVVGPVALDLTPLSWLLPWVSGLSYLSSSDTAWGIKQ